jgi:hypothetical protein
MGVRNKGARLPLKLHTLYAPVAAAPVQEMEPSPALQIIGKMKDTPMGPGKVRSNIGMTAKATS